LRCGVLLGPTRLKLVALLFNKVPISVTFYLLSHNPALSAEIGWWCNDGERTFVIIRKLLDEAGFATTRI